MRMTGISINSANQKKKPNNGADFFPNTSQVDVQIPSADICEIYEDFILSKCYPDVPTNLLLDAHRFFISFTRRDFLVQE